MAERTVAQVNKTKSYEANLGKDDVIKEGTHCEVKVTTQECSESEGGIKQANDMSDKINKGEYLVGDDYDLKENNCGEKEHTNTNTVTKIKEENSINGPDGDSNKCVLSDEEEDVPPNFFDDLMNEDFIDGLNVVDAWDESDTFAAHDMRLKDQKSPIRFPSKSPNVELKKTPTKFILHTKRYREKELHQLPHEHHLTSPRHQSSRDWQRPLDQQSLTRVVSTDSSKLRKHRFKVKKSKDVEELDVRRDPSKTKRDIQRDKDKCAKDEEARIISEKLKVCETGLVPPGTEMDVDLDKFSQKEEVKDEKIKIDRNFRKSSKASAERTDSALDFTAKYANRRSRSLERILKRKKLERIRDLERLSMERRSLERRVKVRRSLERRSLERRRNTTLRARSRNSRSPHRHSSVYRRSRSIEYRKFENRKSIDARVRGRLRSQSRSRDNISLSPPSDISERESWLRLKARGRSRSGSPLSKKSRYFLKELDRLSKPTLPKKSFLKELEEKLFPLDITGANTSNIIPHQSMPPQPMIHPMHPGISNFSVGPVPPPMPVPHPNYSNSTVQRQEYDQQFFIGPQSDMIQPPFAVHCCPTEMITGPYLQHPAKMGFLPQPRPEMFHGFPKPNITQSGFSRPDTCLAQPMQDQMPLNSVPVTGPLIPISMTPLPPNVLMNSQNPRRLSQHYQQGMNNNDFQGNHKIDAYKTLLEEKKITLSDFLSLTAKFSENTKPIDIKKKIEVITRCQEAIRELSEDAKLCGSFTIRKIYKSVDKPLEDGDKYQSPYKKIGAVRFNFTSTLEKTEGKLNVSLALNRLLMRIGSEPIFESPKLSPILPEASVMSSVENLISSIVHLKPTFFEKFIQTEEVKCEECETRKSTKCYSVGVQTVGVLTFDIGCQVPEEIFQKSLKSILKTHSLAHLTPAQLLAAQSAGNESPPRDLFPAARKIPQLELSPDSKSMRMGISSIDTYSSSFSVRADRVTTFDLTGGRFGASNTNTFDIDRYDNRFSESDRDRFNNPVISPNLVSFERSNLGTPSLRSVPFANFSSKLNFEPPNFSQKSRNTGQISESTGLFFEPPQGQGSSSSSFQQGGQRY